MKSTSSSALLYTIRELGRRAGADAQWIATWRVTFNESAITLFPQIDSDARIVFPCDRSKPERFEQLLARRASEYSNCIVPFDDREGSGPLFLARDDGAIECRADILTATLWTLARMEELRPIARDEHGRVSAQSSIAFRDGYLERPIVDEYGAALREALEHLLPTWTPRLPSRRLKLSHDMDQLGIPPRLRRTLKHLYPYGNVAAFLRDVGAAAGLGLPAYLHAVYETGRVSSQRGLASAFYWTAARRPSEFDRGYDLQDPRIRAAIEHLQYKGFEIGLHPAYSTFGSQERLDEEVAYLRAFTGSAPIGGRMHYLRWRPETWTAWERAGLAYDSTVGYDDRMGFRAGTAVPYHPWIVDEDRESALLEIPLIVMDGTPVVRMKLADRETLEHIFQLIERCERTGGVFTLLWHNMSVIDRPYKDLYPQILDRLASHENYDCVPDLPFAPLPRAVEEARA